MKVMILAALALLAVPVFAAENPIRQPVYHDCRPSQDIIRGRAVWKRVCQNEDGNWVEVPPPEKKKAPQVLAPVSTVPKVNPVKRPVYHDCRPSQDIVKGREVWKTVCQNEDGNWVEMPPR